MQNNQMARAGNWQKLCDALNNTQNNCLKKTHIFIFVGVDEQKFIGGDDTQTPFHFARLLKTPSDFFGRRRDFKLGGGWG